jgi:serine protease Do
LTTLVAPTGVLRAAEPLWSEEPAPGAPEPGSELRLDTVRKLSAALIPAVVVVETEGGLHNHGPGSEPHAQKGRATGFVVNAARGWVVTNQHVIEKAKAVNVILANGERYGATIVGADEKTDLALLAIDKPPADLAQASLGASSALQPGDFVVAIGNPFGLSHSVTFGVVSGLSRSDVKVRKEQAYAQFIQTDAFIHKGSSGGPLVDMQGRVVGINTAIRHEGITLSIPIDMLKVMLPHLAQGRVVRAWLGVQVKRVSHELATKLGMKAPRGALISALTPGGPAQKAGLEIDDVVLSFGGVPVRTSDDLPWLASTAGVAKEVELEVNRGGQQLRLRATLTELPDESRASTSEAPAGKPRPAAVPGAHTLQSLGLTVSEAAGAVSVSAVKAASPSGRAGVRAGDIIRKASGETIVSLSQLEALVQRLDKDGYFELVVERSGDRYYVPVDPQDRD